MNQEALTRLLDELCARLGMCLPPTERQALTADPPTDSTDFTDAVLRAEGLDPLTVDRSLRRQVSTLVARAFESAGREA